MDDLNIVRLCLMHLIDVNDFHPNLYPLLFATCVLQVKVNGEPMAMMQDKDSHMYPTIPCVLYFLLHLQQLEIGGFTLANGMFKWQKMRCVCGMCKFPK